MRLALPVEGRGGGGLGGGWAGVRQQIPSGCQSEPTLLSAAEGCWLRTVVAAPPSCRSFASWSPAGGGIGGAVMTCADTYMAARGSW